MESERIIGAFARVAEYLDWIPDWAVGLALIALAVSAALLVHGVGVRVVRHAVPSHHRVLRSVLLRTIGPTRMALVVFACAMALRAAPFQAETTEMLARLLVIAFIALVAWILVASVRIATDLYLRRFQIDSEDNFLARKHVTQMRILQRAVDIVIVVIALGLALTTFESVRQFGVSLFASAGVAGLAVGLAARPLLANLVAGIQIAVTQPIRIGDAVLVENEWGWIDDITSTYVVIKLWDWRRLIVPLAYFIEKPFQNWTRDSAAIIGSVFLHVDYTVPVDRVRERLEQICRESKLWDGRVVNLQVTDAKPGTLELRALVSSRTSPASWDLRCEVREKLIAWLQQEHPDALPRQRIDAELAPPLAAEAGNGFGVDPERHRPPRESAEAQNRRPS